MQLNDVEYYYVRNGQGDIIALFDQQGNKVVTYTYDAWGNITNTTDTSGISLSTKNPYRYRGYRYDEETGLYYLQSRYYNPTWGRFINADAFVSTGQGFVGNNMFAYAGNNPVMYVDPTGFSFWSNLWEWGNTIAGIANPVSKVTAILSIRNAILDGKWNDLNYDFKNGSLNPFNQSADIALNAKVVSFYKGSTVVKQNMTTSCSIVGTIWLEDDQDKETLNHEWGHSIQERIIGPINYLTSVALPSVTYNKTGNYIDYSRDISDRMYYSKIWERTADWLGGVNRNNYDPIYKFSNYIPW